MHGEYIYLSPHLDDAVLSCGGLIFEQIRAGKKVEVWTVTAGDPDPIHLSPTAISLHQAWGTNENTVADRRVEDVNACRVVGAKTVHLHWRDCIYRFDSDGKPLIEGIDEIFTKDPEKEVINQLSGYIKEYIPPTAQLVAPMGIGRHIDHLLTHQAVISSGIPALYYADYPYVTNNLDFDKFLDSPGWQRIPTHISSDGLLAWQNAIEAYTSQLKTFWEDRTRMELAMTNYCAGGGGALWISTAGGSQS